MKFVGMSYRGKVNICADPHLDFHQILTPGAVETSEGEQTGP